MRYKLEKQVSVNLMPGELHIAKQPILIKTLLGSCVSVILHSKRNQVTGISHAQLPYEFSHDKAKSKCMDNAPLKCNTKISKKDIFKYITCSTQYMLEKFFSLGIQSSEISAKIFGGSDVLSSHAHQNTIGKQNIESAHEMIKRFNLKLINEDTGGTTGRTIYLYTETFEVLVRKHTKSITTSFNIAA